MDTKWKNTLSRIILGSYLRRIILAVILIILSIWFLLLGISRLNCSKTYEKDMKRYFMDDIKYMSLDIYGYTDYVKNIRNGSITPNTFKNKYMESPIKVYIIDNKTGKEYTNLEKNLDQDEIASYIDYNSLIDYKKDKGGVAPFVLDDKKHLPYLEIANDFTEYYWYDKNCIPWISSEKEMAYILFRRAAICFSIVLLCVFNIVYYIKKYGKKAFKDSMKKSLSCRIFKSVKDNLFYKNDNAFMKPAVIFIIELGLGLASIQVFSIIRKGIEPPQMLITIICLLYIVAFVGLSTYGIFKYMKDFNKILIDTKSMATGDFSINIEQSKNKNLKILGDNINTIKEGYTKALNEKIKNERLKTELISNVSHDLKTPLTSIINYIGLLQSNDISEEEKKDYIKILDKKSIKLKNLIENLFEISKTTSGNIELKKENLDIVDLIYQVIGEQSNYHKERNIKFKVSSFKDKVMINVDGKRMSRVIENLVMNAIKYSLKNTRIYVDINEDKDNIIISFKNIASYEMDFDTDEIFERFKRGEKWRNSEIEGSGLGLAIAKSIVDLHDGKMYIEKEADMFKVFVCIKKI